MIYGIKTIVKYLLGIDQAARNFLIYPDDTFVVSYPKSGNTWTRFLIANLLHPTQPVTFANIERLIPDTSSQSSRALKRIPRPRVIKSHEYFDPRYKRVIYIVRDPRDVALSYYHFQRKSRHIEDNYPLESYVDDFVNGNLGSTEWGNWGENVGSWLVTRWNSKNFLLLRYEDMLVNADRELRRVASFLDIHITLQEIGLAIKSSSAPEMRSLERLESDQWCVTKHRRQDIPFVRSATSGGWKTDLPKNSVAKVEGAWGELMLALGYELVSASSRNPFPTLLPNLRKRCEGVEGDIVTAGQEKIEL